MAVTRLTNFTKITANQNTDLPPVLKGGDFRRKM